MKSPVRSFWPTAIMSRTAPRAAAGSTRREKQAAARSGARAKARTAVSPPRAERRKVMLSAPTEAPRRSAK